MIGFESVSITGCFGGICAVDNLKKYRESGIGASMSPSAAIDTGEQEYTTCHIQD
jgi:hypothetical protein